jgi:hypothetical protein
MESVSPWVAIGISAAVQVSTMAFAAGMLWSRMRNLEKAVLNGLSDKLRKHGERIDSHGEVLSAISERCAARIEVTREIKERLAKIGA